MRFPKFILAGLLLANVALAADDSWQPLFNGKDLTGWETYMNTPDSAWNVPGMKRDEKGNYTQPIGKNNDPLKVFLVENVDGRPAIHISGQGFGTMTTTATFTNFHVRLQVKWGENRWGYKAHVVRDSGLLYFCHGGLGTVWDTWPHCIEFQIEEHDVGDLFALGTQVTVPARMQKNADGSDSYLYDAKGEPTLFVNKNPPASAASS